MTTLGLRLPVDIPWKRIGVSMHMMDPEVCDRRRPSTMQPSLAIFSYEPDEALGLADEDSRVTFLKITCSITSYGATNLDKLRHGKLIVSSPYRPFDGSSYEERRRDTFDSKQKISGADLPCFGALLEVSVGPHGGNWKLAEYPYFSDFDPKKRELYELVTDTGEIMSRSLENAGVLHGGTTSNSNEVFDKDSWGIKGGGKVGNEKVNANVEGNYASESGSRSVDSAAYTNVRSVDAAREARETYSHTTQISQMYQLLTSYHLGTNRAVFFVEPRPHIIQRDRTFVDGPRQLDGIQEFFLVVVRPKEMDGICVDASLETLHVGAVEEAEQDMGEKTISVSLGPIGQMGSWPDPDEDKTFAVETTTPFIAPAGYVIDRFREEGGYKTDNIVKNGPAQYNVTVTDKTLTIWGRVEEHHYEGGAFETDRRDHGLLQVELTVYLKPEKVPDPAVRQFAILTNTSVCTCAGRIMLDDLKIAGASIVREFALPRSDVPLGKAMDIPTAEAWRSYLHREVRGSPTAVDRYPRNSVGFWDTDVMRDALLSGVSRRQWEGFSIGKLSTRLSPETRDPAVQRLKKDKAVNAQSAHELLRQSLHKFAESSGLSIDEAARVRRQLSEQMAATAREAPDRSESS